MDYDRKQLDRLLSMDDESFKLLAKSIADAAGASKMKTEMLLSNPEALKSRLASLSDAEAQALARSIGQEKGNEIMRELRERGVDFGR
ncbi:MAG: hypothetical protein IKT34_01010 [Clostridia bacterium]|nr:hypothetical protein [Clostridia bacterium]